MFVINFILWLGLMLVLGTLFKKFPNSDTLEFIFYISLVFGLINVFF